MKLLITLLVTLGIPMGSYGQFTSGNELLGYCKSEEEGAGGVACISYLMGVVDTHDNISSEGVMDKYFCSPEGVNGGQLSKIVVKYMEENPEQIHYSGTYLTLSALIEAYPCED